MRTAYTLLMLFIIVSLNTVAQDSAQARLPEGAKARLDVGISDDLEFSSDGTRLVISGGGSGVRLYDLATDDALTLKWKNKPSAHSVAFSPDSETLATAGWDSVVRLWDVEIGKPRDRLHGNLESVRIVTFSPDGRVAMFGTR